MKKKLMLINASHEEESRVAIVEDSYLQELDIESAHKAQTKSNIYKGTITKVEASLQAAFVEYGSGRQGFLPINEIHPDYWKKDLPEDLDTRKVNIQDVLERKQPVLVQVVKEERGTKGAALTTYVSLAGRYLVLNPNASRGGISRKLGPEERRAIKQILAELQVPDNMGLIVRTAGRDQKLEALERDYTYLRRLWDEIRIKAESAPSPSFIYLDGDLATRAIRDHFTDDISEIWVDDYDVYQRTKQFVHAVLPGREKSVKLYRGKRPLFRHYGVEAQCEEIHEREIRLPSGGSIVFDPTEALTSIDVNSARSTGSRHIDDTALETNLEAAAEVARQLRIRDIGGLIVVDFIDMASRKHAQQVEETLRDACRSDKARIQLARISRFGLLEMSRQRLHPSVRESTTEICPRCQGRGHVRTVESMALQMLTRTEDHAEAGARPTLIVQVPSDTGEYLMNNKREHVARIEEVYGVQVNLQIRPDLDIPHYRIERHWADNGQQRIEVLEDTVKGKKPARSGRKLKPTKPIVGIPAPEERADAEKTPAKRGLWARLRALFSGPEKSPEEERKPRKRAADRREGGPEGGDRSGPPRRRRSRGGRRRGGKRQGQRPRSQEQSRQSREGQEGEQQARNEQKPQGEQRRRRRRRRRRRPGSGNGEGRRTQGGENGRSGNGREGGDDARPRGDRNETARERTTTVE